MCGILGYALNNSALEKNYKLRLNESLLSISHRGPDASGTYFDNKIGLGHARLSVLDLSDAGNQPMLSKNKRFVIVYNGEVYNFKSLAVELEMRNLNSTSDSEVILCGFEKIGEAIFEKLNGMFSIAVYDKQKRRLWLARDRFGIKPLYVHKSERGIVFCSEIKGINSILSTDVKQVNIDALHEWSYYGNTLGVQTLYDQVNKLLPGHYIEVDTDNCISKTTCYWSVAKQLKQNSPTSFILSQEDLITQTKSKLESAVKKQLVSDVPVGVFLSGGIDSSAIAAFASKHYQGTLVTYSAAFDFNPEDSELKKAKLVSEKFGTDHHEVFISGFDVADVVEKMIDHHDTPFSDAANIPLYLLCDEIKGSTKVVLQGDGGDELFGGYKRYATLANLSKMKLLSRIGRNANKFLKRNSSYFQRDRYFNALLASSDAEIMALLLTVEQTKYAPINIFSDDLISRISINDPFSRYKEFDSVFSEYSLVDRMFYVDKSIILPDIFLEKVDRSTMASSIEVRVPFLDNDLVNFCLGLPSDIKLKGGVQKYLLKKSLEGIVPESILYGQKKGFGVPFEYWIKTSLSELLSDSLSQFFSKYNNILSRKRIDFLIEEHKGSRKDNGFLLWKLLNFVIWANKNNLEFDFDY